MKKSRLEHLATLAEICAAVAVVISVVYLGMQVQGSIEQLRAQSYNDTLDMLHRPLELVVQDDQLPDVILRARTDPANLTASEWYRYTAWQLLRFDAYEHAYYAHEHGEIEDEIWKGIDVSFTENLARDQGAKQFWLQDGDAFAEPFHGFVQKKLNGRSSRPARTG